MNKEKPKYLLAVMPSLEISSCVNEWKQSLIKEIGRFGSDKSLAHITIMGFNTDSNQLPHWINGISTFCKNQPNHDIGFNGFASFGSHAYYIKPDNSSEKYLNNLIRNIHHHLGFKIKSIKSHMTIARELDEIRIERASKLFKNHDTDFKFLCDGFTLRKFNETNKQYSDFIAEFKFSEQQLKLF